MSARLRPGADLTISGALLVGVGLLAVTTDFYGLRLLTIAGTYALMVVGYQFIFGLAGSLSLAQGTFFGLGAYVAGILASRHGVDFAVALPAATIIPTVLAAIVAIPVLRLESHYFALATLGVGQVVLVTAVNWESMTGGANGLAGVPPLMLLGQEISAGMPLLTLVWIMVAAAVGMFLIAGHGARGLAFRMLRDEPLAAASIGLDGGRYRLASLLASAALGGAGGAVYVHTSGIVSPEVLDFPVMVACLSMAVIGGRSTATGAIIGALALVHLPEWFRFLEGWYLAAYGAALLLAIVVAPEGVAGLIARLIDMLTPPRPRGSDQTPAKPMARETVAGYGTSVELDGIVKRFGGIVAVNGVSLTLEPGKILGLIGPNGSGKTTLANIVSGFEQADAGSIRCEGIEVGAMPAHARARAGFARTFQAGLLVADMTVLESVTIACDSGPMGAPASGRDVAAALLSDFGLSALAEVSCGALPQGSRRMVEIARAVALRPKLIVLDEPAAGLSGHDLELVAARIREIATAGTSVLLIEHNMPFLMALADRVACLDDGRLVAVGEAGAISDHPEVIEVYLGTGGPLSRDGRA